MTLPEGGPRFFLDESSLGLRRWAEARGDVVWPGHPEGLVEIGALDTAWIPVVAEMRLVVVTRDRRLRTRPGESRLALEYGLRTLRLGGKKDRTPQQYAERLDRLWSTIETFIEGRPIGPWWVSVDENGLSEKPYGRR